jgi:hypothetical protein
MQICVARMLEESTIFIGLLAVLGLGFAQAMYALDASDGQTGHGSVVVHQLIQALLQSVASCIGSSIISLRILVLS